MKYIKMLKIDFLSEKEEIEKYWKRRNYKIIGIIPDEKNKKGEIEKIKIILEKEKENASFTTAKKK